MRFRIGQRVHCDTGHESSSWSGKIADVNSNHVVVYVYDRKTRSWEPKDVPLQYAELVIREGPLERKKRKP